MLVSIAFGSALIGVLPRLSEALFGLESQSPLVRL